MDLLIGVDDTNNVANAAGAGTGYLARCLADRLAKQGLAYTRGITRHQLLVDDRIPYTSHNSSVCLLVFSLSGKVSKLIVACREFLTHNSAEGSEAGLCVAEPGHCGRTILNFGASAKKHLVESAEATHLAKRNRLFLEGLTGAGGGVVGALSAVGLRLSGNDGHFIWVEGLRERTGLFSASWLYENMVVDEIRDLEGSLVKGGAGIDLGPWPKPILQNGKAVLLVEKVNDHQICDWQAVDAETVKRLSD